MKTLPCLTEEELWSYLTGMTKTDAREAIELHVAQCEQCFQTLTSLDFVSVAKESPDEAALIETIYQPTINAALALAANTTTLPTPATAWWRLEWLTALWVNHRFAFAGAMAMVVIAITIGFFSWNSFFTEDADLARGLLALKQATNSTRPHELRISGLAYAQFANVRGNLSDADMSKLEGARAALMTAVAKNPTPTTRHIYGQVLLASNEYDKAIEQLQQATQSAPQNIEILIDLATAQAQKGDWTVALAHLNRALTIDNHNTTALFNRAILHEWLKNETAATADWQSYLKLDANSQWAREAEQHLAELKKR